VRQLRKLAAAACLVVVALWTYIAWVLGQGLDLFGFREIFLPFADDAGMVPDADRVVDAAIRRVAPTGKAVRKLARAGMWAGAAGVLLVILAYLVAGFAGEPYRGILAAAFVPSLVALAVLTACSLAVLFFTRPLTRGTLEK
jgi:hypothetical protein